MSRLDFEIFDNIINGADAKAKLKWAERHRRAVLEKIDPQTGKNVYENGYFPVLMEEYQYVGRRSMRFALNNGRRYLVHANYYQSKDHSIAQVATYPRKITSIDGDPLTTDEKGEIAIATYCVNDRGEIVIVNRFDAAGFEYHANNYDIYGPLSSTYERYFTDGYYMYNVGGNNFERKPYASIPHFHFQSPAQTAAMGQEKCNAISLDRLLVYLDALQQGTDITLQTESLGMPFLSYFKNERSYHSTMERTLIEIKDTLIEKGDSCDIPIINYMQSMIDMYQDYDDGGPSFPESFITTKDTKLETFTTTTFPSYHIFDVGGFPSFYPLAGTPEGYENIESIKKDLTVMKEIIKLSENHPSLVARMANTFMEGLNAPQKNIDQGEGGQTIGLH